MDLNSTPTLILGAGPAGMAAALELWKAGRKSIVIEKNSQVGGLARTLVFQEGNDVFRTDIGPHRFFSKNQYLYSLIEDMLGEEWIEVNRLTRFYINDKLYQYPMEIKNALTNIGISGAFHILKDYGLERVRDAWRSEAPANFEEFAVRAFGRTLAELNMLNYTRKIWGVECSELSIDWAKQRIKGLNFSAALKSMLRPREPGSPKTLVDRFYYPTLGAGLTYQRMYEKISPATNFLLESTAQQLHHKDGVITSVSIQEKSGTREIDPDAVVTSIPVTELLRLLDPPPSQDILEHARALRYRSQVYLFLTLNKTQVFPDQWIYLPELEIPFGRVSEMKNFSAKMAPEHATSLFLEFFCWEGDKTWNANTRELLDISLPWLERFGWIKRADIRQAYLLRQAKVYPVYDLAYQAHLGPILEYLDSFQNLLTIGRPGRFKYNNQDHSLEMGILAARSLIEGKHYDMSKIASGKEYFESGYIPAKAAKVKA